MINLTVNIQVVSSNKSVVTHRASAGASDETRAESEGVSQVKTRKGFTKALVVCKKFVIPVVAGVIAKVIIFFISS